MAFVYGPTQSTVLAGFGYGLMDFPVRDILAGWIRQSFSATATRQICKVKLLVTKKEQASCYCYKGHNH
jgi:hypothetical protein